MKIPRPLPLFVLLLCATLRLGADTAVGQFSQHGDIGGPAVTGSATYDDSLQTYRLSAGGINVWGASDQFQYAWNKVKGDFIVRARVEFVGQGAEQHRKLGWMVRSSLDPDSAYVDTSVHGDGLASLQFRRSKGAATEEIHLSVRGGDVIQLERRGNTYTFSSAHYGEPFVSASLADLDLGEDVNVGLFLCAHSPQAKEEALFRDVRLIRPVKIGFHPYQDYIGTRLEVLNVFTGKLEMLLSSTEPFEAPNWTPDGRTLIYNVSGPGPNKGRLRTYNLATGVITPLETGVAIHNNNDHVLSFDGKQLGVSNHTPEENNRSTVWTLPATGGVPKRITANSPSYLHGWSPDGQWLVFTGGRKPATGGPENYDIYKIAAAGGPEIQLTNTPGLNDGPEYSPDGQYIYFNSTRSGLMQLWRMKPDGAQPEQITTDDYNNWFPHVSPDGKWIAFISFPKGEKPDDHPYYRHVYLRLLQIGGGVPRVIAYLYGGQGTINVPSWSPDSTRIAFVSNSGEF